MSLVQDDAGTSRLPVDYGPQYLLIAQFTFGGKTNNDQGCGNNLF